LFLKNRSSILGVDISTSAVKVLQLGGNADRFQVEARALEPLPPGAVTDRNIADPDEVGNAIRRAVKASGSSAKSAAVAVPTSSVITRTVPMPSDRSTDEIETEIRMEAPKYIPYPLDEVYLDFEVRGVSDSNPDTLDVTIVASRRENVEIRQEALEAAGLKATIVDVDAYAVENAFGVLAERHPSIRPEHRVAVVDIGAALTTLTVIQNGTTLYTRDQTFGCDQLTNNIGETYGLSREQAEVARRSGDLPEDYGSTILAPFQQSVLDQINHSLQFFTSASHYSSVDCLLLIGGGSLLPGLDAFIMEHTGIPTFMGNPFEQMSAARRVNRNTLMQEGPLFFVACGLALRSFDHS
jgi:type IV pilus assembly protein PilM